MDREKVIQGLDICYNDPPAKCGNCPYYKFENCYDMLCLDALALLKEQEAVSPTWQQGKAYCGSCGKRIPLKIGARYCHKCGNPVRWN